MIHLTRRFELVMWGALPGLITLLLAVLFLSAKHISGMSHFMPALPLIPVFYWGMMKAREMPYWFVFMVGLVIDSVSGLPLGLSSLLYVFFLVLLHAQRKYFYKEGFVIKWGYFALLLGATSALNWVLLSLFNSHAETVLPAVIQWFLTVGCYPALHKGFDGLTEHIHSRRWHILHGH
jgi:rod shape-determining protein MreD